MAHFAAAQNEPNAESQIGEPVSKKVCFPGAENPKFYLFNLSFLSYGNTAKNFSADMTKISRPQRKQQPEFFKLRNMILYCWIC